MFDRVFALKCIDATQALAHHTCFLVDFKLLGCRGECDEGLRHDGSMARMEEKLNKWEDSQEFVQNLNLTIFV